MSRATLGFELLDEIDARTRSRRYSNKSANAEPINEEETNFGFL